MAYKKAKLARFYHFSDAEMDAMSMDVFQDYWLAIDCIEAQELLLAIQSASFPYMKNSDRDTVHSKINKKTKSIIDVENESELTTEEVAKKLAKGLLCAAR